MKKTLTLLLLGTAILFVSNSCNKTCKCQGWLNGEKTDETYVIELRKSEAKSCDEKSTVREVNGKKTGIECR